MTQTRSALAALLLGLLSVTACGGGSGGAQTPPPGNATITGTVRGTTAIAFIGSSEVARSAAAGTPKRFTLSLPAGGVYRIFLVENEGTGYERVYALYQGASNLLEVASAVAIDLGFVDTSSGVARPSNDPTSVAGVRAAGEDRGVPPALAASAFTTADLAGTWNFVGLVGGDSTGQRPGWYWGSWTADATGAVTVSAPIVDSLASDPYTPGGFSLSVSHGGVVTIAGAPAIGFRGLLSHDRALLVAVATMAPGRVTGPSGQNLQIAVKAGASYAAGDLQGTSHYLSLITGSGPGQRPGWYWGDASIHAAGSWTFPTVVTDSMGNADYTPQAASLTLSADGILGFPPAPSIGLHGLVSRDKGLTALVATMAPGRDTGVSGYNLQLAVKGGARPTWSSLAGGWRFHMLKAGSGAQQRWAAGTMDISDAGAMTPTSIVRSDGDATLPGTATVLMSAAGILSLPALPQTRLHGVVAPDQRLIAWTMDDGGLYDLMIMQR